MGNNIYEPFAKDFGYSAGSTNGPRMPMAKEKTEKLREEIIEIVASALSDGDVRPRANEILQVCKESGLMFVNHQLLVGHPYYQAIRHSVKEIEL